MTTEDWNAFGGSIFNTAFCEELILGDVKTCTWLFELNMGKKSCVHKLLLRSHNAV